MITAKQRRLETLGRRRRINMVSDLPGGRRLYLCLHWVSSAVYRILKVPVRHGRGRRRGPRPRLWKEATSSKIACDIHFATEDQLQHPFQSVNLMTHRGGHRFCIGFDQHTRDPPIFRNSKLDNVVT